MTGVQIAARLLGTFEVDVDGRRLDRAAFERPSGLRLLKLLLATPEHRVRREVAAELLWPEAEPDRSVGNLRKAIHFARRGLSGLASEHGVIAGDGDWLRFAPGVELDVDVDRLLEALGQIEGRTAGRVGSIPSADDPLEIVATLGGADLLPEDPYEEWLVPLRERLRDRVIAATLAGVTQARRRGELGLAGRLADRALAIDPADETAHRALIEMHLEAGRLHAARRQLLACRRALAEAYAVEPSDELIALVDTATADRARARRGVVSEPEIIGRRLELDRTEPVLDAVAAGELRVLLIRGPAGIGKSRLLREVARLGASGGWRLLELRGLELSADTAFASLGHAIAGAVGAAVVDGWPEPARSAILTISPSILEDQPASTARGDTEARDPVMAFATDAGLRAGLVEALRRLRQDVPLIIAIDDVQWLDRATISLVRAVVAAGFGPTLVAASLRDEPRDADPELDALLDTIERSNGTQLRLAPLGRREIELVVQRELEGSLGGGVGGTLAELSGGMPLYALQLLRGARESGAITLRDGRWQLANTASPLPVPEGVRRLVADRAARLAPDVRTILRVAAELGDDVSYEVLVAAAAAAPDVVLDALDRGLELDLLVERAGRYQFGHPLFRAVLRGDVPRRSRGVLHGRIAAALANGVDPSDAEALAAAIASGIDALGIASHAAEAVELGMPEALPLAIGFGFAAGARQNALFDHAGAAATLRRALGLWSRLAPADRAHFPVSSAHHRLGVALKATGDDAAAAEAFRAEVATADDDMDRARGYAALSWLPYEHARFDRSAEVLREEIAVVEDPMARASLEIRARLDPRSTGNWPAPLRAPPAGDRGPRTRGACGHPGPGARPLRRGNPRPRPAGARDPRVPARARGCAQRTGTSTTRPSFGCTSPVPCAMPGTSRRRAPMSSGRSSSRD